MNVAAPKIGDHVDVYISTGETVGPGKITEIVSGNDPMVSVTGVPTVWVIVERPRGGPYEFRSSQSNFRQAGPDTWKIYMPTNTRSHFLLDEEEES
jgi:hypothetical protein